MLLKGKLGFNYFINYLFRKELKMSKPLPSTFSYNYINYNPGVSIGRKKKSFLNSFIALGLIVFWCFPVNAQITLTSSNVGSFFSVGTTMTGISDTVTKSVNIGTTGATSWDFSSLKASITTTSNSVTANSTPFFGYFPNAIFAQQTTISGLGTTYVYYSLGTDLLFQGSYLSGTYQSGTISGTFSSRSHNIPEQVTYHLPVTFGTTWKSTYADSSISTTTITSPIQLPPTVTRSLTNNVVQYTADAYGTLTLPGGGKYQAIRVKIDRRETQNGFSVRTISYFIISNNGSSVSVDASDTLQSNSGTINVSSVGWSNSSVTAVQESNAIPAGYTLLQNYPNPFNPITKIKFGLPSNAFTTLKIYDIVGREVKTLVNAEMTTGYHEVELNANDLSSGIYLYKLHANNYTDVKKLILLK
jgi:hypothetical protein